MKHYLVLLLTLFACISCSAQEVDEPQPGIPEGGNSELFAGKNVLVAYFSWGGTTKRMAEAIQETTGGTLFEIVPVTPYPSEYTPCTEVALEERDNNARPAIKDQVKDWDKYDVVFIGCPVWWHTAPMIISTFCETYDFAGKTVVPFCTYAATYRDETLQKIVDLTPKAGHLEGLGTTGSTSGVKSWVEKISKEYSESHSSDTDNSFITETAPMSGKVELWRKGNIAAYNPNINNSDGKDFVPNMLVYTVPENVTPKGAVMICPGGAFAFRSMSNEGYPVAEGLRDMGYQCFIVNYRIQPYSMQVSALDLQRAIRYVRSHAEEYRINPENIALVGFSAGGILNGEVLLNWQGYTDGSKLDATYIPDALDKIASNACAVGMIYSFYGRLSVSMNNVETLRAANLPPAFYCWGTRDGFAGQFTQNSNAVREAGCDVTVKILDGYPHGYGWSTSPEIWGKDFDEFLTPIMEKSSGIESVSQDMSYNGTTEIYNLNGMKVQPSDSLRGIYIVRDETGTKKVVY